MAVVHGLDGGGPQGAVALAAAIEQALATQLLHAGAQFIEAGSLDGDVDRIDFYAPLGQPAEGFAAGAALGVAVELHGGAGAWGSGGRAR